MRAYDSGVPFHLKLFNQIPERTAVSEGKLSRPESFHFVFFVLVRTTIYYVEQEEHVFRTVIRIYGTFVEI